MLDAGLQSVETLYGSVLVGIVCCVCCHSVADPNLYMAPKYHLVPVENGDYEAEVSLLFVGVRTQRNSIVEQIALKRISCQFEPVMPCKQYHAWK